MTMNPRRGYPVSANSIHALREQQGMSLEQLAAATGVHIKTIQDWLNGSTVFFRNIVKLANALDANWIVENNTAIFAAKKDVGSESIEVIFRIPGTLKTVNRDKANQLISLIRQLAGLTDDITVHAMNEGNSVNIIVRMSRDDVDKLVLALVEGKLADLDLLDIAIPSLLGGDRIYGPKLTRAEAENVTDVTDAEPTSLGVAVDESDLEPTPSSDELAAKRREAELWVNSYTAGAAGTVMATALFPGSASAILFAIEATMIAQIGRIYDHKWTLAAGAGTIGVLGTASLIGQLAALEAAILLGPFAFLAKPMIAAGIVKTMGKLIIDYFESRAMKNGGTKAKPSKYDSPKTGQEKGSTHAHGD